MADTAHYALLDRPGIGAGAEHFDVMIRFHDEDAAASQMVPNVGWHVPEVGSETDLDAFGAKGEADGIGGVMRNGEGHDLDIADAKAAPGGEMFRLRQFWRGALFVGVAHGAAPGMMGWGGDKDGHVQFFG